MISVFKNAKIVTMNSDQAIIDTGYLTIKGNKISGVGHGDYHANGTESEIIDLDGSIIIPGLVNAHSHSYANIVKGTSENIPLEIWMLYVMKEGKRLSNEDIYISSLLGSMEMLKGGVTTFLDHLSQTLDPLLHAAKAYKEIGIRAWVTPMFMDKNYDSTLPGIEDNDVSGQGIDGFIEMLESLYEKIKNFSDRINMGVGPSAPHRCSDNLLTASYGFAEKYNLPWHTHVLESKPQKVKAQQLYQTSMISHLNQLGILSERCSFAHVVWLTDPEMDILADKGVSVVHNPVSNLYLGSGIMPLLKMRAKGINVALGTDGANCNGSQSMFETMKLASILSNTLDEDFATWLSSLDIFEMATNNSARALFADDNIGSIEVGKDADFSVLSTKSHSFVPLNNLIWQIVYGTDHHISSVYVAGRKVVEDGKVLTIDEDDVYREANERARSLLDRLKIDYRSIPAEQDKIEKLIANL